MFLNYLLGVVPFCEIKTTTLGFQCSCPGSTQRRLRVGKGASLPLLSLVFCPPPRGRLDHHRNLHESLQMLRVVHSRSKCKLRFAIVNLGLDFKLSTNFLNLILKFEIESLFLWGNSRCCNVIGLRFMASKS